MTASQIPAFKTQQISEYFGCTKKTTMNLNVIQSGVPASGRSRVSIEDVLSQAYHAPAFIESFNNYFY